MRGKDEQQLDVFSYISPEQRVPHDHPLRPLRVMTDEVSTSESHHVLNSPKHEVLLDLR
jgi:hypothetical protein